MSAKSRHLGIYDCMWRNEFAMPTGVIAGVDISAMLATICIRLSYGSWFSWSLALVMSFFTADFHIFMAFSAMFKKGEYGGGI